MDERDNESSQHGIPWWPEKRRERRTPDIRLSQQQVVEAALRLVETGGGVGKLTMRKLAAELGVTPTTVYWWAGNRERILALVVDAIYGQVDLEPPSVGLPWDEELFVLVDRLYAVLAAHSTLVPVIMNGVLAGPHGLGLVDRFMRILLDAQFSARDAIDVHAGVTFLVFGFVSAGQPGEPSVVQRSTGDDQLEDLPPHLYPGISAAAVHFDRTTSQGDMRRAVRTFLDGVKVNRSGP